MEKNQTTMMTARVQNNTEAAKSTSKVKSDNVKLQPVTKSVGTSRVKRWSVILTD